MASSEFGWFYGSQRWKKTRAAYFKAQHGLCERCMKTGVIKAGEFVHHKTHLTNENINDPKISLGWDNLEVLCRDCHAAEHAKKRYYIDLEGNVHLKISTPPHVDGTRKRC